MLMNRNLIKNLEIKKKNGQQEAVCYSEKGIHQVPYHPLAKVSLNSQSCSFPVHTEKYSLTEILKVLGSIYVKWLAYTAKVKCYDVNVKGSF